MTGCATRCGWCSRRARSPTPKRRRRSPHQKKANLKLVDVILEALGRFAPARAIAGSGSSGSLLINWHEGGRPGHATLQYEIFGSAYGAGSGHDGTSMTATHLSNLHITPIEVLESEFPCHILEDSQVIPIRAARENGAAASPSAAAICCCRTRRWCGATTARDSRRAARAAARTAAPRASSSSAATAPSA